MTKKIKRYTITGEHDDNGVLIVAKSDPCGDWVRHAERSQHIIEIEKENSTLRKRIAAMSSLRKKDAKRHSEEIDDVWIFAIEAIDDAKKDAIKEAERSSHDGHQEELWAVDTGDC